MKKRILLAAVAVLVIGGLCAAFFLAPQEGRQAVPQNTDPVQLDSAAGNEPSQSSTTEPTERAEPSVKEPTAQPPETAQTTAPTEPTAQTEPIATAQPEPPQTTAKPTEPEASETEPPETEPPEPEPPTPSCTVSITCADVLEHMDELKAGKESVVPESGWILGSVSVPLSEGDTVFDILQRVTRENGISLEFSVSPLYGTAYIEGIGNLYERDCGATSGWIYAVNGVFPSYGCSDYAVQDGDSIAWIFSCTP